MPVATDLAPSHMMDTMDPKTKRMMTAVSSARARIRRNATLKEASTALRKRAASQASRTNACTICMALITSPAIALVSATRSWLRRDRRRTRRPNRIIGTSTAMMTPIMRPVSFGLVTNNIVSPPTSRKALRNATEAPDPMTDCRTAVSDVRRESTSPVLVVS